MEIAMAEALCCVYTHVVVVEGGSNQIPYLETYDGSMDAYGECSNGKDNPTAAYTSINVMEDVMGSVCGMSMGSRDCFDQGACIEVAKTMPPPFDSPEISVYPSPVGSNIPTVSQEPTISDFDDDDNSTTLSSFPSSSASPSQALSFFPRPSLNRTNATISSASSPLEFISSSGTPTPLSAFKPILLVSFFYCVSAFHFLF